MYCNILSYPVYVQGLDECGEVDGRCWVLVRSLGCEEGVGTLVPPRGRDINKAIIEVRPKPGLHELYTAEALALFAKKDMWTWFLGPLHRSTGRSRRSVG